MKSTKKNVCARIYVFGLYSIADWTCVFVALKYCVEVALLIRLRNERKCNRMYCR